MRSQLLAAAATLAVASQAGAQDSRFAVGLGAGTTGLEAQAAIGLSDSLSLRGSANFLDYDYEGDFDGVNYDTTLEASTAAAFVDLRPFANALTLTGGAYLGSREVSLAATPTAAVDIGGISFDPGDVGRLEGEMDLGELAPYAGVGFDNTFTGRGRVGLRLSAGIAFGEEPEVSLSSVGGALSGDPALQQALRDEEEAISDDAELLRYYPVASAGLFVKF
jgi:hypothetical protein